MGRNRELRVLIQREMEKLENEKIFESAFFQQMLLSVAGEMTGSTLKKVELVNEPEGACAGQCSKEGVVINLQNRMTVSFPTVPLMSDSLMGVLGHECGHWNFSDFKIRKEYLEGLENGEWYQGLPKPETEEEKEHLKEINGYFEEKHPIACALLCEAASFIQNMLEDIFVEQKMCERYPGSIRRGILQNRMRRAEWIPSIKAQLEKGYDPASVLLNLMAQYSLSGTINNWEEQTGEILDLLEMTKPVIDEAVTAKEPEMRMAATNRILLIIWNILSREIRENNQGQQEEEPEECQQDSQLAGDSQDGSQQGGQLGGNSQKESEPDGNSKAKDGAEESGETQSKESGSVPGKSLSDIEGRQNLKKEVEQILERLRKQLPAFLLEKDQEGAAEKPQNKTGKRLESSKESLDAAEGHEIETSDLLMEHIQELAEKNAQRELDAKIRRDLSRELSETEFDGDHQKVKKVIIRETKTMQENVRAYQIYENRVKDVMRRMKPRLLPVLSCQKSHMERNLFFGPQLNFQALYDPGKRIFRNMEMIRKVDTAVALLIDLSGSMLGERIEQARLCALSLYEFCRSAGIPILIYGHNIDKRHRRVQDETVFLYSFAEFDADRNDKYRIASMTVKGCNRDGAALCFIGEKLAKRQEKIKLLFSISDGFPNATHYSGQKAEEDLLHIKESLEKKRITMLTAAIGSDREVIQRIYKEGFLDISDMGQFPFILPKQILMRIRR